VSDARTIYNASKSGILWQVADLPAPLCTLDPASAAFADAVAAMQAVRGHGADGKLGPNTLAAIMPALHAQPPLVGSAFVVKLLAVAHAEANAHVREQGKNRGARVEEYQRAAALGPGDPWCAAFVAWCMMQAAGTAKAPAWCSGSAVTSWHKGSKAAGPARRCTPVDADFAKRVAPGFVWVRAVDAASAAAARNGTWSIGHTGIVIAVDAAGFHTIEGNTNAAGSREGDGVYRKFHRWDDAAQIGRTVGWFDAQGSGGMA
jgi:hypothetical protein